jgi:hypothetical protein
VTYTTPAEISVSAERIYAAHSNCDETIAILAQMISNTTPINNTKGSTPVLVAEDGSNKRPTTESDEDPTVVETYSQGCLSDEARMEVDQYAVVYDPATKRVTALGEKHGFDIEMVRVMMNAWFFAFLRDPSGLLDRTSLVSTHQIWPVSHRHDQ